MVKNRRNNNAFTPGGSSDDLNSVIEEKPLSPEKQSINPFLPRDFKLKRYLSPNIIGLGELQNSLLKDLKSDESKQTLASFLMQ